MPNELLKLMCGPNGTAAIGALFNTWLREEKIPDEAKSGRVINLYKEGDENDCGNFRGITLLNTVSQNTPNFVNFY